MSRLVIVNPVRIDIAFVMAKLVAQKHPNLVDNLRINKLYSSLQLGFAFEQAVLTLMQHHDVIYQPTIDGADSGDMQITLDTGITINADCKLSCDPDSDKLLVPLRQAQREVYNVYIAGRFVDTHQYEIMGYTTPLELDTAPLDMHLPIPSLYISYDDLYPIEHLMAITAAGEPLSIYPNEVAHAFA